MSDPEVSVIIVFRNEERHLRACLESVVTQFDNTSGWELILVNGMSDDRSVQIASDFMASHKVQAMLLENPGRTLSKGWNIGIKHASGRFLIRPDAHATLGPGYIQAALKIMKEKPEVGAAGGILVTKAITFTGNMIRIALSMRTGVGNSSFRTGEASGYKDTVVYGLYRKEVFEKAGLFNEKLVRHQDTEFHHRVMKSGYRFYMSNEISAVYYCRDSFRSLGKQMFDIGYYFSHLVEEGVAGAMRMRHWIPAVFYSVLFVTLLAGLFFHSALLLFMMVAGAYTSVIFMEALLKSIQQASLVPLSAVFIIPFMHFRYALGTVAGLFRLMFKR